MKKTITPGQFALMLGTLMAVLIGLSAFFSRSASFTDDGDSRTFKVSNFDKVDLGSAFNITVRPGATFSVRATGRRDDLDDLEADVSGSELRLRYRNGGWMKNRKNVKVEIVMPRLEGASFSGASNATVAEGFPRTNNFELEVSGASRATVPIQTGRLRFDGSGASTINLTGQAESFDGDVSGATTLRASDLQLKNARVEVSGASNAHLHVTGRLDADASGASSVRYRGGAQLRSDTSGASSVRSE